MIPASPGGTPRRPIGWAVLCGTVGWLLALAIAVRSNDERVAAVLLPLWRPVFALAGNGPNLGTAEQPAYEGTPVHFVMSVIGIVASSVVYMLIASAALRVWRKRNT